MTTNQQLKTHCEDVIANPQDHPDWVVDMAKALLPCLEAKPVFFVEIEGDDWTNSGRIEGDERPDLGLLPEGINHLYVAPPAPVLKVPATYDDGLDLDDGNFDAGAQWMLAQILRLNGVTS